MFSSVLILGTLQICCSAWDLARPDKCKMTSAILPGKFEVEMWCMAPRVWCLRWGEWLEGRGQRTKSTNCWHYWEDIQADTFMPFQKMPESHMQTLPKALKKPCVERRVERTTSLNLNRDCCDLGENPSVFKWELEQILLKAERQSKRRQDSSINQFMRGLPKNIKIKLMENDPVPDLPKMLSLCKDTVRFKIIQVTPATPQQRQGVKATPTAKQLVRANLVALVSDMAVKQQQMEEKVTRLGERQIEQRQRGPHSRVKFRLWSERTLCQRLQ